MPEDTNLCDVCASGQSIALIQGRPFCPDHYDTGMKQAFAPVKEAIKMATKPPANAVECGNCSGITMDPDVEECAQCGTDDYLMPVIVIPCPSEHPADCNDDDHHFGIDKHVSTP